MTSRLKKATPFHVFVLASLVAASGGIMHLSKSRIPTAPRVEQVLVQVVPQGSETQEKTIVVAVADPVVQVSEETAQPAQPAVQQPAVRETTAQKRARYAPYVAAASRATRVDEDLIEAVITAESAFNPLALSSAGALGLMQLMPATAERFGVTDRLDPEQNILGGARYLSFLLNKFNNNLRLAVAAYNAGEGNVMKYSKHRKHRNRIPPFKETAQYVPRVLAYYKRYNAES
jgi:soluble lytic murein transglycosylase-like protein